MSVHSTSNNKRYIFQAIPYFLFSFICNSMKCLPYAIVVFILTRCKLLSVHRWWFCCCLFIVYCSSHCLRGFVLCPCFVLQYFLSFLVLQSSHWGRESWLFSQGGGWGGVGTLIFPSYLGLDPTVYCLPPTISGILSTQKKYLKF